MGTIYKECNYSESILLVYCSDNDTPDRFFPADPRLIQAHRDSQNEPKPPPTPPASPVSGITTPSTTVMQMDFWELGRSATPSPTFDIPMTLANEENKNTTIDELVDKTRLEVSQNNNDPPSKKAVTFAKTLEFIEYKKQSGARRIDFTKYIMKKRETRRLLLPKNILGRSKKVGQSEMKGCKGCYVCQSPLDKRPLLVEKCQSSSFATEARETLTSMIRRVRKLTSRIFP